MEAPDLRGLFVRWLGVEIPGSGVKTQGPTRELRDLIRRMSAENPPSGALSGFVANATSLQDLAAAAQ
jgi:hypothetical protein